MDKGFQNLLLRAMKKGVFLYFVSKAYLNVKINI